MYRLGLVWTLVVAGATTGALGLERAMGEPAATVRVEVDLSERKLYLYNGGSLMNTFPVAIGTAKHPTPTGTFTISRIVWNPDWVPPAEEWAKDETRKAPGDPENPMQGAKIFFMYPDYYIHGTNAAGTVGTAASHGCLRMNVVDVQNLAQFLQQAGGAGRSEGWYGSIRASRTERVQVRLPNPIRITIRR